MTELNLPPHIQIIQGAYFNTRTQRFIGDYKIEKICDEYWNEFNKKSISFNDDGVIKYRKIVLEDESPVKSVRRQNSKKLRKELDILHPLKYIIPYKNFCCYCETPLTKNDFTREHIIPIDKGGKNTKDNVRSCCRDCNKEKDNLDLSKYLEFLQLRIRSLSLNSFDFDLTAKKIKNAKILLAVVNNEDNSFAKYYQKYEIVIENKEKRNLNQMSKKIEDVRDILFEQLERLKNAGTNEIKQETERAQAMIQVSHTIIESAKAETDFLRVVGGMQDIAIGTGFITSGENKILPKSP